MRRRGPPSPTLAWCSGPGATPPTPARPPGGAGHAGLHPVHRGPRGRLVPARWPGCVAGRARRRRHRSRASTSPPGPRSARSSWPGARCAVCARPPASGTAPTSWSPTSTPSTSTATSCRSPARSAAPARAGRSLSGFVILAGVRGTHARHAATTSSGSPTTGRPSSASSRRVPFADDPTIYACVSSVTDASPGPSGPRELVPARQRSARAADRPGGLPRPRAGAAGSTGHRPAAPALLHRVRRAGRPGRPVPQPGRGHLRHVLQRAAGGLPAPGQPRDATAACTWSGGSSHPGGGLPLVAIERPHRRRPRARRTAGDPAPVGWRRGWPAAVAVGLSAWPGRARRGEPLTVGPAPPTDLDDDATISVVIPARNEEDRLAPVLELLAADPSVTEVIVVDDESRDGTAAARPRARGDRHHRCPAPAGLGGQAVGSRPGSARPRGDWVVCFDADVEPSPGLARALVDRVQADGLDMASVAGRFVCPTASLRCAPPRLAHDARLPLRSSGGSHPPGPGRVHGQRAVHRRPARADLLAAGGYTVAAGNLTDDVALARSLAAHGLADRPARRHLGPASPHAHERRRRLARLGPIAPHARRHPRRRPGSLTGSRCW